MDFLDSILIIDDEEQIRRLLEISLGAKGYKIYVASNGKKGIIATATYNLSLVILDLGLPDIDGLDVLKQIRVWFQKPILILSVRNSELNFHCWLSWLKIPGEFLPTGFC